VEGITYFSHGDTRKKKGRIRKRKRANVDGSQDQHHGRLRRGATSLKEKKLRKEGWEVAQKSNGVKDGQRGFVRKKLGSRSGVGEK